MEKYTFEQVVNERKREFDELKKNVEKFKDLVTYNECRYEHKGSEFSIETKKLFLEYQHANTLVRSMHDYINSLPQSLHIKNAIIFDESKTINKRYNDDRGNNILTVNDPEEFKEKFHEFIESPLVKELSTSYDYATPTIKSLDGKTKLNFSGEYAHFNQKNFEMDFYQTELACIESGSFTAPQILEMLKESTFDSSNFSEYFAGRIENDKNKDLSIELDDNYKVIKYKKDKNGDKDTEYFYLQKEAEKKKLILTKKI